MPIARKITGFHLAMAAAVTLAFFVRLQGLGEAALSDREAAAALSAHSLLPGFGPAELGVNPIYAVLTGSLFFLFGPTNFLARLVPAAAGAALALIPGLHSARLGRGPAFLMAIGLALDPVLVGVSRLAAGPVLGATFLLLALSFLLDETAPDRGYRGAAAGVFVGLALLSGPDVFVGAVILSLTWAAAKALGLFPGAVANEPEIKGQGREIWIALAITLVAAGTLFLRFPQGLGAFAASLPAFFGRLTTSGAVPPGRLLVSLAAYQGILIIFAGISAWRSTRTGMWAGRIAGIWAVSALAVALIIPGRQVGDLVWAIIPLWGLGALEVGRPELWRSSRAHRPALLSAVLVVLLVGFWTSVSAATHAPPGDPQLTLRLLVIAGTIVLAGLSVALVALGWDGPSARSGTVWGIVLLAGFGMLSGNWGTSDHDTAARRELWLHAPQAGHADLLRTTLHTLSGWERGQPQALDIAVSSGAPSVRWALRDFPGVQYGNILPAGELPSIIVAETADPAFRLASSYRGQGILWQVSPQWESLSPEGWLRWMLFREAPAVTEEIVLWARADLFLSGADVSLDPFPLDALEEEAQDEIIPLEDPDELFPGN